MFGGLLSSFGLSSRKIVLGSPLAGRVLPLTDVADDTFSACLLGDGVAIKPTGGRVVAPADAKVESIFPTGHAVALRTYEGIDVLIHVGIDTVKLQGRHFTVHVSTGDVVHKGDVLIEFDREAIAAGGYDITVPVLVRNSLEFSSVKGREGAVVAELDDLIEVKER